MKSEKQPRRHVKGDSRAILTDSGGKLSKIRGPELENERPLRDRQHSLDAAGHTDLPEERLEPTKSTGDRPAPKSGLKGKTRGSSDVTQSLQSCI
ncbi:hypothetical protein ElyMa_000621700 [Elysia marginata]|uniref:Uncharacterized protein n=1 Tax=Elysia marginata TaxID=1093978 RepID=A0AAV4G8U4_9GAST|nr:hypothetical protein ElyMa_000621700 [Elysia marginata]